MARFGKHKSNRYITGGYSIPTFVTKPEKFDAIYDVAILRRGKDKKLHYFIIDEETFQEVEITPDQAWEDFRERLFANAMSHDIIPACLRILERDGWDCSFDELHIDEWQNSQPFVGHGLCQFSHSEFYQYLNEIDVAHRFFCAHNSEELLSMIESSFNYLVNHTNSEKEDWEEKRNSLKCAIYDLITIAPCRNDSQQELNKLQEFKRLNDKLISEILGDVFNEVKRHPGLDKNARYISDIERFVSQIE